MSKLPTNNISPSKQSNGNGKANILEDKLDPKVSVCL